MIQMPDYVTGENKQRFSCFVPSAEVADHPFALTICFSVSVRNNITKCYSSIHLSGT